jgi:hypothetical protein
VIVGNANTGSKASRLEFAISNVLLDGVRLYNLQYQQNLFSICSVQPINDIVNNKFDILILTDQEHTNE